MTELTKYERETIILFNDAEQTATICTANKSLQNRLDRFCSENQTIYVVSEDEPFKKYNLPKKWIKVNMPHKISEERRAKLAEMGRRNLAKHRTEEN